MALGLGLLTMASCNDFLDREPKSDITPQAYFTSEADLAAYTINQYTFRSIDNGSYGIGPFGDDNGTDNQAAMSAGLPAPGMWVRMPHRAMIAGAALGTSRVSARSTISSTR